jgi:hypothetical protein
MLWLADLDKFAEAYSAFSERKKRVIYEAQRVQAGVVKAVPKKRTYAKKAPK